MWQSHKKKYTRKEPSSKPPPNASQLKSILAGMYNMSEAEVDEIFKQEKKQEAKVHRKQEKHEYNRNNRPNTSNNKQHKDACEKYMESLQDIKNDNFGILGKIKKIKKLIISKIQYAEEVTVYYSTVYPMLIVSYYEGKMKQFKKYKHMREILKEVPSLKTKVDLFDDIFSRIYSRVDPTYYSLVVFALQKAQDLKIRTTERNLMHQADNNGIMFFYSKGTKQELNFVIFDQHLRSIQFNSLYMHHFRDKYKKEYRKYEELYEKLFGVDKDQETNDLLDKEEMDSVEEQQDEEVDWSLHDVEEQIEKYLAKDLSELEKKIQDLEEELQDEAQKDANQDRMLRISEQIQELEQNRANYENVRDEVTKKLKNSSIRDKKISLKKLIIADKQLESKLPIIGKKSKIFEMLRRQNLLIIEGQTGSGKSTQLPQLLCEYYKLFDNPDAKPVLVTQPRKLATRSLAERVAMEMGERVGDFVDYVASAGKSASKCAKIIFKLDRLVLDELTEDNILSKYSCLVIDQAHERTMSIDVILGLIKNLLEKRRDFKVIVTSASMDIQLFENYFKTETLRVSGRMYPVTINYRDYKNLKTDGKLHMVRKIQKVINQQILIGENNMKGDYRGHLLCFCSGVDQITELVKIFSNRLNSRVFTVLPLHGKITPAQQRKVFEPTGTHKFIFASRIAQTAITIDGVRVVIDPGQDIELIYDQKHKISTMQLVDISQSSAKQRAGRSGRTAPGHCFRLYSEQNFKSRRVCKTPEMENSSLEAVVLRLKSLKIDDVVKFPYLSKPSQEGLINSLELLTLIGALEGKNQEITKIGQLLIKIPIDPFLSRAIVEGIIFQRVFFHEKYSKYLKHFTNEQIQQIKQNNIIETVTVILSLLINFSNLFFIRVNDRQMGESVKFSEFSDEQGDFFFLENIYRKFFALRYSGRQMSQFQRKLKKSEARQQAQKNFLNHKTLQQAEQLVEQIKKILKTFSIQEYQYIQEINRACQKMEKCQNFRDIILSCLITSFSPNLCKFSGNPHIGYTLVNQRRPVQIYGTSNLSLLGIQADWIICYDLYTNQVGRLYCKVAHKVSYDFIKCHADPYIQERFQIAQIQKKNPFYEQLKYDLPTNILGQIRAQYGKGYRDEQLNFLKDTYPIINEQKNEITFYILVDDQANNQLLQKMELKMSTKGLVSKVKNYVADKLEEVQKPFRYNYLGSIFISIRDGFIIKEIDFDRHQYNVEIITIDRMIQYILENCSEIRKSQVYLLDKKDKELNVFAEYHFQNQFKKAIVYIDGDQDKRTFVEDLIMLRESNPYIPMNWTVKAVDNRKKVPRTKVLLHYFAGNNNEKNTMFMSYDTVNQYNPASDMALTLKQGLNQLTNSRRLTTSRMQLIKKMVNYKLSSLNIKTSKKENGVNVFSSNCDEFEMAEYLHELERANLLGLAFKHPKRINKFRDPDFTQAPRTNADWIKRVSALLKEQSIPTGDICINIRGYWAPPRGVKLSALERSFRVDMTAELLGFDLAYLQRLKVAIDGKKNILGCQKVHVRCYYDQVMAIPNRRVFEGLQDQYQHQLDLFKTQYPLLFFHTIPRRIKNVDKIMIIAYSPNKQDFKEPQRRITDLYTPQLVKLQPHEFVFVDRMDVGMTLLDNIQWEYSYKIYFGLDRFNKILKVYCHSSQLNQIQKKVKKGIQNYQFYYEKISYRGKNLNKVVEILNQAMDSRKDEGGLVYQIFFQRREIGITASMTIFEQIKNKLLKLSNSQKGECPICFDVMRSPYKLINCGCVICWSCIANTLREIFASDQLTLSCPIEQCAAKGSKININDFKTLLPEEQFHKISDVKIRRYLESNEKENSCMLCKFCENILYKDNSEKDPTIECNICNRKWCLKCKKEGHQGFTCTSIALRKQLGVQDLHKMGIKLCPNCGIGIEKNRGCNHMTCTNCGAHICWKCLKYFSTKSQCQTHLADVQGGIFGDDIQNQPIDDFFW